MARFTARWSAALVAAAVAGSVALVPVAAHAGSGAREQRLADRVADARERNDRKAYKISESLSEVAEDQARRMARKQRLYHNPELTSDVKNWQAIGENVAYASSVARAHELLMNSPPHRANLLSSTFTQVGYGVVEDDRGTVWVVQVFRKPA